MGFLLTDGKVQSVASQNHIRGCPPRVSQGRGTPHLQSRSRCSVVSHSVGSVNVPAEECPTPMTPGLALSVRHVRHDRSVQRHYFLLPPLLCLSDVVQLMRPLRSCRPALAFATVLATPRQQPKCDDGEIGGSP